MKFFASVIFFLALFKAQSQSYIVKDIRSFGAKGDGKTNDQAAFQKASDYFNKRGGYGKLIISKGIYVVGKQSFTGGKQNHASYEGENVLHFSNIKNFNLSGEAGSELRYLPGLRFGTFSPATGAVYDHGNNYFVDRAYAAIVGYCILFENSYNIIISRITVDGNCNNLILGGVYGDTGIQLPHSGIYISNSRKIQIDNVHVHHFGLDGITIVNKETGFSDSLSITNSTFEYNARQGLSWVGGNQLYVKNCKFNHTGKGKFNSAPGAGVDIEAEVGPVKNGVFVNCEFTDNIGCGLAADSGNSGDCTFTGCTFWGTTNWSIWTTKPGFSFNNCKIYGSIVHGFSSPSIKDATTFNNCTFEDKIYNRKPAYGNYLVEINGIKRMSFTGCSFISNVKKLCWLYSEVTAVEEKYQLTNCSFTIKNSNLAEGDFACIIRGAALKNCTFTFTYPGAKKKRYYLGGYGETSNADLGLNKVIYKNR